MEVLGIGPSELIFIIIIAIIVLGPKDIQKAGKTIGRWLNQLIQSDGWKAFQQTSNEIRNIPRTLMREANMEMQETQKEIRKAIDVAPSRPAGTPLSQPSTPPPQETNNIIQPPSANPPETETDSDEHA